jgi:hypothetical protein
MAERPRFSGTAVDLIGTCKEIVEPRGRAFLIYDEAEKVQDAKLDVKMLLAAKDLLVVLRSADQNLNFNKSLLKETVIDDVSSALGSRVGSCRESKLFSLHVAYPA